MRKVQESKADGQPRAEVRRVTARDAAPFFARHTTLPAIIEAGLEGRLGSMTLDGDAARLTLGCYEAFGGDAGSQGARLATSVAPGMAMRRLDLALADQLDSELEPHGLQVFDTAHDLVKDGLGFGAVTADGVLACAATSYTLSARYLEVAIATRAAFRGRGLALAVAAALIAGALERKLVPSWSASNPVSKRLAERLGFRPARECEVLLLR